MDGSPSRGMPRDLYILPLLVRSHSSGIAGETIPIRLFLGGFDLTPTFREVNKKYSTRYYLSLVLIDEGSFLNLPNMIFRFLFLAISERGYFLTWSDRFPNSSHIGNVAG